MYNTSKYSAGFGAVLILILVAVVLLVGGLWYNARQQQRVLNEDMPIDNLPEVPQAPGASGLAVKLLPQNNSGEEGIAALTEVNGKAVVTLHMSGMPDGASQPAHIHLSSCATIGAVKYPLQNITDGISETTLSVPLADILAAAPLSVNVHKSSAEAGTYVACGDILPGAMPMVEVGEGDKPAMMPRDENTMMGKGELRTIDITAKSFEFSQKEIRVKKGDRVHINFKSKDGLHDWVVDEFNAATGRVQTGGTASVEFTADKAGTFEYYCSVGDHRTRGMKGMLIVE